MIKQRTLIEVEPEKPGEKKYSTKVEVPVYEPRGIQPPIQLIYDDTKTKALLKEIEQSSLSEEEKKFLRAAAHRHTSFHFEKVADFYAHASEEMQDLMEKSALVIIDFNSAIENGFVRVCSRIHRQYIQEYREDEPTS